MIACRGTLDSMNRAVLGLCVLVFAASLPGQTSLSGTVSDPRGAMLDEVPIQLKNKTTGAVARTFTKPDGHYKLAGLAAGTYELTITMPCCAYQRVQKDVALEAGENTELNLTLAETVNGITLGDDPARLAALMRKRAKLPSEPVPRTAGGKPDLSGVWVATDDPYPEAPDALPWAAAIIQEHRETFNKDSPHNHCLPGSLPVPGGSAPFIARIIQTPTMLVMLFEDVPGFRQIYLDGRPHPANWDPSWLGHSIGKWDGDTLVVDTTGFNDRSWIGGLGSGIAPHTEMLHMTERYRRVSYGHMEVAITFEDPGTFAKPWHLNETLDLAPQEEVVEYVCENNKPEHLVGK